MDIGDVRALFPGTRGRAFLDAACVSLLPQPASDAVSRFLSDCVHCPAESSSQHHVAMDAARRRAIDAAMDLVHCRRDELALVESTTHGLNIAVNALEFPPGSNVLVSDLEFMQVAIPWTMQADRGIEVRLVNNRDGRVLVEDFVRMMDARTAAVIVSAVQWSNGYRVDVKELARECRQRDVTLIVDAIQHLGGLPFDVGELDVDFMTAGGHKWLNAPLGCGLAYINRRLQSRMKPDHWGYLNLEEPDGGWVNYFQTPSISPVRDWRFVDTAQLYETGGTANYPGAIALAESISIMNEVGPDNIERHILDLTDYLWDGLTDIGATIITRPEKQARSGIVVFRFYGELEDDVALMDRLHAEGVYVAMRFTSGIGGIRVSCHMYNDRSDIDRLVNALKQAGDTQKPDYAQRRDG